jgi:hypothetical protein|tara:strand:- start:54 stop:356 length:303 start_codon:yes stop_codon:yes gene_type:complete
MTKIAVWNKEQGSHVRDMTAEEEAEFEARQKAWNDNALNRKLLELRTKRNNLLKETDFYALSDVTMSSDMATYRQNLRDLTNGLDTAEKVDNVTWPTKPS